MSSSKRPSGRAANIVRIIVAIAMLAPALYSTIASFVQAWEASHFLVRHHLTDEPFYSLFFISSATFILMPEISGAMLVGAAWLLSSAWSHRTRRAP